MVSNVVTTGDLLTCVTTVDTALGFDGLVGGGVGAACGRGDGVATGVAEPAARAEGACARAIPPTVRVDAIKMLANLIFLFMISPSRCVGALPISKG